jgi:N-acetylgalactosamine-6-sulfatase
MDITASLVRIAAAKPPADRPFDGIDILADLESDQPPQPRTLFWRQRRGERTWRAAREGDLKRIWRHDGDAVEQWLFDLSTDPGEKQNVMAEHPAEAARLESLLVEWERHVEPRR